MVTEHDIRRQVRRLLAVYNTSKPEDEIVEAWQWVLGSDVEPVELMAAVSDYAKSGARYMPTPGALREAAIAKRAGRPPDSGSPSDWNQTLDGPCPVCGAVLQLAPDPVDLGVYDARAGKWRERTADDSPPPKRYRVLHDGHLHRERGEPIVGDAVWHR